MNNKLGIPKCDIPSFEEIQKNYEAYRAKCKKTTEQERLEKKAQGCVTPVDGVKKKSYLKVINCKNDDNHILIRKDILITILIIVIIYVVIIFYKRI